MGLVVTLISSMLFGTSPGIGAQDEGEDDEPEPIAEAADVPLRPGRIAYVNPLGEVIVAESDGSGPYVVGRNAVSNDEGLAPLAWSPDGAQLAFVRDDRKLVMVPSDGVDIEENTRILADDAIVPPGVDERIISFMVTENAIAYIGESADGKPQAKVLTFFGLDENGVPEEPTRVLPLTDPATRDPVGLQFSPLDPYLYLRSRDVETGEEFTLAVGRPLQRGTLRFAVLDP